VIWTGYSPPLIAVESCMVRESLATCPIKFAADHFLTRELTGIIAEMLVKLSPQRSGANMTLPMNANIRSGANTKPVIEKENQ
jgi:hypothetical protein